MMGDKTGIQWTDATWNPIVGCSIVSPGCKNCYAMKQAGRIERMGGKGGAKYAGLTEVVNGSRVWTGKLRSAGHRTLTQPLRWRRPRTIFVNSMGDLFHEDVQTHWIDQVFAVMARCPQHRFQVLTKRAARMRAYMGERFTPSGRVFAMAESEGGRLPGPFKWPLPNVWLGVSAEDQRRFDERVEHLGATPAAVRFVSCEPLLEEIDFGNAFDPASDDIYNPVDWVIIGGESGPGARPCDLDWIRWMLDQCRLSQVPCFVKQLGKDVRVTGQPLEYLILRHPKGGDPAEWPPNLRVRDMPDGDSK